MIYSADPCRYCRYVDYWLPGVWDICARCQGLNDTGASTAEDEATMARNRAESIARWKAIEESWK